MATFRPISFLFALLFGLGCLSVEAPIVEPTMGQQMMDLKAARDSGAITEDEYEKGKKVITMFDVADLDSRAKLDLDAMSDDEFETAEKVMFIYSDKELVGVKTLDEN